MTINCWITMQDPDDKKAHGVWVKEDPKQPARNKMRREAAQKMSKNDFVAVYVYGQRPLGIQYIGQIDKLGDFKVYQHDNFKHIDWLTAAHLGNRWSIESEESKTLCSLPKLAKILEPYKNYGNNNILAVRHYGIGSVGYLTHEQMKAIWPEAPISST